MPETSENILNLVNASGFLFQLRVEQEIRATEAFQHGNLDLVAREHRWVDPVDGTEGFIDLILKSGIVRLVIECKRVSDATWVFLNPDGKDNMIRARMLWTSSGNSDVELAEWHDFGLRPVSPEAAFCVVRGQGEKDSPMLERVSSVLLRSLECLANEEINLQAQTTSPALSIYCPMIVTNAALQVCRFNVSSVDISTGRLNDADFEEVPFIRFRKNLSSTLANRKPQSTLEKINLDNERTVFVINAAHLTKVMQEWEVPYKLNAPWPWERIGT